MRRFIPMVNIKRILSIILAVLTVFSFAACSSSDTDGKGGKDTSGIGADTTAVNTDPDNTIVYEKDDLPDTLNFGGTKINILSLQSPGVVGYSEYEWQFTVEELTSEPVNDSVYNREQYVEDRLGVEIDNIKVGSVTNEINKTIDSGDDIYQAYVHANHILTRYVLDKNLTDLYTVEYLDFDKPWWADGFNDCAELMDGLYLATGSLCLSLIRNCYGVYYNKTIAENYKADYPGLDDLYGLVEDGKWTFDKFVELGGEIYLDNDGDSVRDLDDLYGISFSPTCAVDNIWSSFEIGILSKTDDGWFEFNVNSEKLYAALEKVYDMVHNCTGSNFSNMDSSTIGYNNTVAGAEYFADGKNLFYVSHLGYAEQPSFRNMQDDYGILPFPKYNEAQKEYYSYSHDTYGAIAIPNTNTSPEIAGAVLEAMASYSYRYTIPTYLDVALKGKYMSDPQSRHMLDIIIDGIKVDSAWIYLGTLGCDYPTAFRTMITEGETAFASTNEKLLRLAPTKLKAQKSDYEKK